MFSLVIKHELDTISGIFTLDAPIFVQDFFMINFFVAVVVLSPVKLRIAKFALNTRVVNINNFTD